MATYSILVHGGFIPACIVASVGRAIFLRVQFFKELNMDSGIYQIKNKINGKVYIGYSKHLSKRKGEHLAALRANKHYNKHLQSSFNQYGELAFEFSVLELCQERYLKEREKHWIAELNAYQTDAEKQKRAASIRRYYARHPDAKIVVGKRSKMCWDNRAHKKARLAKMYVSTQTDEYRAKLSAAARKNWPDETYLKNQAAKFYEASHSAETQAKRTASLKATYENNPMLRLVIGNQSRERWATEEYREKHKASHDVAVKTTEYREKMSQITAEHWNDPEYRARAIAGIQRSAEVRSIPVLQVETGVIFHSATDAAESLGRRGLRGTICSCCLGRRKTAGGYHWRHANESEEEWLARRKKWVEDNGIKERPRVLCVENGTIFEDADTAVKSMGITLHKSGITKCCTGQQETFAGYHWRYADQ